MAFTPTRREFVKIGAMAGAGLLAKPGRVWGQTGLDPIKNILKFVDPLPLPGGPPGTALSLATPNKTRYNQTAAQADFYQIVMGQYNWRFHRDLPNTRVWGYADATNGTPRWGYLGATIVATKGTPTRIDFVNRLPGIHPLPVDNSLPGAETAQLVNRAAVHLHGGFVPWASDGGPYHWFAPTGQHGPSWVKWLPNQGGVLTADSWWTNHQSSRLLWYHDHAVGITRLNAYAGLAAGYVLVDGNEVRMFGSSGTVLPNQLPGIVLVLQEKSFKSVPDQWGRAGDLYYPSVYGDDAPDAPVPSCVPEFFGDTAIVNGKAYPQLTLPVGVYRFRMLNAAQSRVLNLQLYREDPANPGDAVVSPATKGPDFIQIGTESGFLPAPAVVPSGNEFYGGTEENRAGYLAHDHSAYSLVLAPAERADVIIDFTDSAGASFILYSDAPAPFAFGDELTDYYTGHAGEYGVAPDSQHGPNTRTFMRITITAGTYTGPTLKTGLFDLLATELSRNALTLIVPNEMIQSGVEVTVPPGSVHRNKTLSEGWDEFGRLQQFIGTDEAGDNLGTPNPDGGNTFSNAGGTKYGKYYAGVTAVDPSETYSAGAVEVWDFYNTTGDVHPIHFHLFDVQILGRAPFAQDSDGNPVDNVFAVSGPWVAPDDNERGYKETVRMNPGEVTRVILEIKLPPDPVVAINRKNTTVQVPKSPRTGGYEYVFHCHILEHEEHDMMRPLVVF